MWKTVLIFLSANFAFIILVVAIYAFGFEYDKANKLYAEPYYFAYDASIMAYGKRWERVALTLLSLAAVVDLVAVFIWFRKIQSKREKTFHLQ